MLPITLFLNPRFFQSGVKPLLSDWISDQGKPRQINSEVTDKSVVLNVLKSVFTRSRILFGLVSGTIILFCTGSFFRVYRWEFFLETVAFVAFNKACEFSFPSFVCCLESAFVYSLSIYFSKNSSGWRAYCFWLC